MMFAFSLQDNYYTVPRDIWLYKVLLHPCCAQLLNRLYIRVCLVIHEIPIYIMKYFFFYCWLYWVSKKQTFCFYTMYNWYGLCFLDLETQTHGTQTHSVLHGCEDFDLQISLTLMKLAKLTRSLPKEHAETLWIHTINTPSRPDEHKHPAVILWKANGKDWHNSVSYVTACNWVKGDSSKAAANKNTH